MATLSVNSFGALRAPLSVTNLVLGAAATQVYTLPAVDGALYVVVNSVTDAGIIFGYNNVFVTSPVLPLSVGTYVFAYSSNSKQVRIATGVAGALNATLWANQVALT